jgi:hypothetical protein
LGIGVNKLEIRKKNVGEFCYRDDISSSWCMGNCWDWSEAEFWQLHSSTSLWRNLKLAVEIEKDVEG